MSKFYGKVGYCDLTKTAPGVISEDIVERSYYGDALRNVRRLQSTESINDNINISTQISIVADPFALDHFQWIRYVEFMGAKWKVTSVEVQFPRLVLELGGLYNVE